MPVLSFEEKNAIENKTLTKYPKFPILMIKTRSYLRYSAAQTAARTRMTKSLLRMIRPAMMILMISAWSGLWLLVISIWKDTDYGFHGSTIPLFIHFLHLNSLMVGLDFKAQCITNHRCSHVLFLDHDTFTLPSLLTLLSNRRFCSLSICSCLVYLYRLMDIISFIRLFMSARLHKFHI